MVHPSVSQHVDTLETLINGFNATSARSLVPFLLFVSLRHNSLKSDKISQSNPMHRQKHKKRRSSQYTITDTHSHQWRNRKCNTKSLAAPFFWSENDTHPHYTHKHMYFCLFRCQQFFQFRKKSLHQHFCFRKGHRNELAHQCSHLIVAKPNLVKHVVSKTFQCFMLEPHPEAVFVSISIENNRGNINCILKW